MSKSDLQSVIITVSDSEHDSTDIECEPKSGKKSGAVRKPDGRAKQPRKTKKRSEKDVEDAKILSSLRVPMKRSAPELKKKEPLKSKAKSGIVDEFQSVRVFNIGTGLMQSVVLSRVFEHPVDTNIVVATETVKERVAKFIKSNKQIRAMAAEYHAREDALIRTVADWSRINALFLQNFAFDCRDSRYVLSEQTKSLKARMAIFRMWYGSKPENKILVIRMIYCRLLACYLAALCAKENGLPDYEDEDMRSHARCVYAKMSYFNVDSADLANYVMSAMIMINDRSDCSYFVKSEERRYNVIRSNVLHYYNSLMQIEDKIRYQTNQETGKPRMPVPEYDRSKEHRLLYLPEESDYNKVFSVRLVK